MISSREFGHLFDPARHGFSVSMTTGKSPTSGYMVSEAGSERTIPSAVIHPSDLYRYAQDYAGRLSIRDRYMGGWNDVERSQVDLDTSMNLPSGGPVEHAAAKVAMIRHGQRSMYNVDTGDLEWNEYYGQSPEVAHHDIKRRYEEAKARP